MFIRFSALLSVAALVASVAAAPSTLTVRQECATGTIQCCTGSADMEDPTTALVLKLYGLNAEYTPGLVGYGCSPTSIVGVGSGASCGQEPMCCNNNTSSDGLVSIGCTPIGVIL